MKSVSISELKAHLSRYVREVRRGSEVQILDRGRPVARLTGLDAGAGADDRRERLVRAGVLRSGTGEAASLLDEPPIRLPVSLGDALGADREDRL